MTTRRERNLPVQIGDFHYRYTADGQRYYKEVFGNEEYYLMDAELTTGVFSNTGTGYELDYWNILGHGVEGRYVPGSGYRYYYKDHLGSTRAVVNATGTILDATDYYPFGLAMPGRSHTTAPGTKEGFTGHERDDEVGLDYMVARRYDPALGRFLGVDPLNFLYPSHSKYHYVGNTPINGFDPDGMAYFLNFETGSIIWVDSDDDEREVEGDVYVNIGSEVHVMDGEDYYRYHETENEDGSRSSNIEIMSEGRSGQLRLDSNAGFGAENYNYSTDAQQLKGLGAAPEGLWSISSINRVSAPAYRRNGVGFGFFAPMVPVTAKVGERSGFGVHPMRNRFTQGCIGLICNIDGYSAEKLYLHFEKILEAQGVLYLHVNYSRFN